MRNPFRSRPKKITPLIAGPRPGQKRSQQAKAKPKSADAFTIYKPALKTKIIALSVAVVAIGLMGFFLSGTGLSADFIVILCSLLFLSCILIYDIINRQKWEQSTTDTISRLVENHDRLVREVARNRNDVAGLKDGLSQTAYSVEQQGRKYSPSLSIEARMLETIISKLGEMGERPRPSADQKAAKAVMDLEIKPPSQDNASAPATELEATFEGDLERYNDNDILNHVREAIRNDDIDIFFQPIVNLPQRKTRFFETFARLKVKGGYFMPANSYMGPANKEKLMPAIDNLLLLRCLQLIKEQKNDDNHIPFILNISSATLHDRGFMGDLITFLSENKDTTSRLIFELPQEDISSGDSNLVSIINGLSKLGCRFSIDRINNRRIDSRELKSKHIRFIKMNAEWLLNESKQRGGFSRIARLKKQLDINGIDLIVEKIETEDTLRELLDFSIDFGQGYLFGKPNLISAWYKDMQAA